MESQSFEFAGIKSKLTSRGEIRKPALCKMLRSGKVKVFTSFRTTDDYAFDNASDFGRGRERCPLELADDIARRGAGWWTSINADGSISISCHSFLYLTMTIAPEVTASAA